MSQTILVADDNLTIQRLASKMLGDLGLAVITVANGVAAVKKLPALRPALVLADVDMPGKDGYEVCAFVKSSLEFKDVPVLLAVSEADPYDAERGKSVGVDGIVKKPFNREELASQIIAFLERATPKVPGPTPTVTDIAPPLPVTSQLGPAKANEQATAREDGAGSGEAEPGRKEPPLETNPASSATHEPYNARPELPAAFTAPQMEGEPAASGGLTATPDAPGDQWSPDSRELEADGSQDHAASSIESERQELAEEPASKDFDLAPAEFSLPSIRSSAEDPEDDPALIPLEESPFEDSTGLETLPEDFPVWDDLLEAEPTFFSPGSSREAPLAPPSPRELDASLISSVVVRVVEKMSPSVLAPEVIDELARRLTDEVTAELKAQL